MEHLTNLQPDEIICKLSQFTSTFNKHKHCFGTDTIDLSDGCQFVKESCNAHWLFNTILLHQLYKDSPYLDIQEWTVERRIEYLVLKCIYSNGDHVFFEKVSLHDFPLNEIRIYFKKGIAMLPTEYKSL